MAKQSRIGSHFEQKLPNNDCICCIYGQSDKTDKDLEKGQLFIQFLGGSSGPEQINQLRTSFFLVDLQKKPVDPLRKEYK